MNDLVSKLVREDVPIPCAAKTTASYRDRLNRLRKRRDPEGIEDSDEEEATVRRVMGIREQQQEQPMDGIFPEDAEDLDDHSGSTLTTPLRSIKDVVQEPSHPTGEKEKLLTPYAALTAPDVTPQAMEPIDPSNVPGMEPADSFTSTDLSAEGVAPNAEPSPVMPNAMDVLLGRKRGQTASAEPTPQGTPPPVMTEESASRMFNPTGDATATLQQGVPMPIPEPTDGRQVMEAFRRFKR